MRVLILGCGYVGLRLGAELKRRGHEVFGVRRSLEADASLRAAGIEPVKADLTQGDQLGALPTGADWVVNVMASSKGGGPADYRQTYLEGTKNLINWMAAAPPKKFIYTSSTGVYGQTDGSQVKETSPTEPAAETAQILVETENLLKEAFSARKLPAVILRVAGIYGPDRTYFLQQYLKNDLKIEARGERIMNMIHVDDLVGLLQVGLTSARAGEIYNAVDDEPVMQVHFFRWLSETLGKWMPPFSDVPVDEGRKRGLTNKKVLNRKVKMELGYKFLYPTFRQGYTAEIQRLEQAGQLQIDPEPR